MRAYVPNGEIKLITGDSNITTDDFTILNIHLLTAAERKEKRIFDFIPAGAVPPFHHAGATSYEINEAAGIVTETVEVTPWPIEDVRAARKAELAAHRYKIETAGITINGAETRTDRESQAALTSAWVQVQIDPAALIDWKGANGWTTIDKATVELLAGAVGNHVQQAFSREKLHSDAIDALDTIDAVAEYDITTGWE